MLFPVNVWTVPRAAPRKLPAGSPIQGTGSRPAAPGRQLWQSVGMPTRWEYGSLITIALAPSEQQPPEHTVGILVTAMQARVVSVVELGDLVPGERYAAMNAVGQEGWIITGPSVRSDFSRGTPVRIGGATRLAPWMAQTLANQPVGMWARGYFEYPLRRPLD